MDGKEVGKRACADCPHNQWGTDPKGGKGKACKNMVRVYVLQEGCAFPYEPFLQQVPGIGLYEAISRKNEIVYGTVTKIKLKGSIQTFNEDGKGRRDHIQ